MPKQLYKITQFHGGLNSNSDARDIADNEFSDLVDVMVDELGKIRMMGGTAAHVSGTPEDDQASGWNNGSDPIVPGYGLIQFSHDRNGAEDKGASETGGPDNYLAMYDNNDQQIFVYTDNQDTWDDDAAAADTGVIDLGSSTNARLAHYYADGILRVSDGNFGANNRTQWYGYIYRYFFGNGTSGYDGDSYGNGYKVSKWYAGPVFS